MQQTDQIKYWQKCGESLYSKIILGMNMAESLLEKQSSCIYKNLLSNYKSMHVTVFL